MSESLLIDKLSYWVKKNIKSNSAKLSETCSARNALMFFGKKALNSKVYLIVVLEYGFTGMFGPAQSVSLFLHWLVAIRYLFREALVSSIDCKLYDFRAIVNALMIVGYFLFASKIPTVDSLNRLTSMKPENICDSGLSDLFGKNSEPSVDYKQQHPRQRTATARLAVCLSRHCR